LEITLSGLVFIDEQSLPAKYDVLTGVHPGATRK
jgi:hypothetical protein